MTNDDLSKLAGVGPANQKKLEEKGFTSYMKIAVMSPKDLSEQCDGISEDGAAKIIASARDIADLGDFITATELKERRKNIMRLTTSSGNLDQLFGGGGIQTAAITEFYGEFGSGKTQICLQLAVNATMPVERGGLDGHVIVIDTENTFRPNRIEDMALAHGLDISEVEERIHHAKAYNSAHQILLVEKKADELAKEIPIKLIIVDSLTAHFRSEYIGRGNLGERQQMLNKHMHDLLKFADVNNAAIAVTNQVMANPAQMFGDPTRPIGGHIVGHTSTYRVYLRKGKKGTRVARMIDSPENPEDEANISINKEGVRDG